MSRWDGPTTRCRSGCCTTGFWSPPTARPASGGAPAASSFRPRWPSAAGWPGRAVVAVGTTVRAVKVGDRVLFDPEDRAEVEVRGKDYVLLRERDLHAVAAERLQDGQTGLYL